MVRKGARSSLQRESRRTAWLLYRGGASRFRLSIPFVSSPVSRVRRRKSETELRVERQRWRTRHARKSVEKPETIVSQI